jgi:hypothetical protein
LDAIKKRFAHRLAIDFDAVPPGSASDKANMSHSRGFGLPIYQVGRREGATSQARGRESTGDEGTDGAFSIGACYVYGAPRLGDWMRKEQGTLKAQLYHDRIMLLWR